MRGEPASGPCRLQPERLADFVPVSILKHHVDRDRILLAEQRPDARQHFTSQQDLTGSRFAIGNGQVVDRRRFLAAKITALAGQRAKRIEHLIVDRTEQVREHVVGGHRLVPVATSHVGHDVVTNVHRLCLARQAVLPQTRSRATAKLFTKPMPDRFQWLAARTVRRSRFVPVASCGRFGRACHQHLETYDGLGSPSYRLPDRTLRDQPE